MVVKMPRDDAEGRVINQIGELWREGLFYDEFIMKADPSFVLADQTPVCYVSKVDMLTLDFVILMEDVAPAQSLFEEIKPDLDATFLGDRGVDDDSASLDMETVEACLAMISQQHCAYLNDKALLTADKLWLFISHGLQTKGENCMDFAILSTFIELKLGETIGLLSKWDKVGRKEGEFPGVPWLRHYNPDAEFIANLQHTLANHTEWLKKGYWQKPNPLFTLVHADFHGDNFLRKAGPDGSRGDLCLIDFQICGLFEPQYDFGYFLMWALSPRMRREHEERLNRVQYDALVASGLDASTYPFEAFFSRYKFYAAWKFCWLVAMIPVIISDDTPETRCYIPLIYNRLVAFVDDHGWPEKNWNESCALLDAAGGGR